MKHLPETFVFMFWAPSPLDTMQQSRHLGVLATEPSLSYETSEGTARVAIKLPPVDFDSVYHMSTISEH